MSENANTEGINIQINNADSTNGGGSFLDRIFDIGLKLIIPLGLLLGLVVIVVLVRVVLPLLSIGGEVVDSVLDLPGIGNFFLFLASPIAGVTAGVGSALGWLVGRGRFR